MTETIEAKLIARQLDNINTGIMLLHMQFVYAEAYKNGIISKADYKNYLRDTIKILNDMNGRLKSNESRTED